MQQELFPADKVLLQIAKKQELEANFYHWLQKHFDVEDIQYLNLMIDELDDEVFVKIAETWASNTFKNKVYY